MFDWCARFHERLLHISESCIIVWLYLDMLSFTQNVLFLLQDAGMCGDSNNTFFELSAARSSMMISDSIVIGGQKRSVKKIMAFKRQWLDDNWKTPMSQLSNRLTGRARRSNDCIIS